VSIVRMPINTVRLCRGRTLKLHERSPCISQEKESLQREIDSTDGRIDRLVYELYGLTEEEIRIVES
jgi:hypothetical protein